METRCAIHVALPACDNQRSAMGNAIPFSALGTADLIIDATYEGGTKGKSGDDVLGKLIPGCG